MAIAVNSRWPAATAVAHAVRSAQLSAQIATLNHDLTKAHAEQLALQHSLALAQQNIAMLVFERDAANSQVLAMRRSTSWRVTAPMRLTKHYYFHGFRKLYQSGGNTSQWYWQFYYYRCAI